MSSTIHTVQPHYWRLQKMLIWESIESMFRTSSYSWQCESPWEEDTSATSKDIKCQVRRFDCKSLVSGGQGGGIYLKAYGYLKKVPWFCSQDTLERWWRRRCRKHSKARQYVSFDAASHVITPTHAGNIDFRWETVFCQFTELLYARAITHSPTHVPWKQCTPQEQTQ